MIGILNRWRQFGRKYFWPHLLLGMVAASFGVSTNLSQSELSASPSASSSLNRLNNIVSSGLTSIALPQAHRRVSANVDYWQQHALRTVIRHLSFALAPQVMSVASVPEAVARSAEPLHVHQQVALLVTLNLLLTHESKPPVIIHQTQQRVLNYANKYQAGLWLSQVQGIRAGPVYLI